MTPAPVLLRVLLAVAGLLAGAAACVTNGEGRATQPMLKVAGYLAPWDPRAEPSLDRPPAALDEMSPVWYQPTEAGDVVFASAEARTQAEQLGAQPRSREVLLVPSVSNFRAGRWDGALISSILAHPDIRQQHIDSLVAISRRPGVAGLDIDYESLGAGDRPAYSAFIRDLAEALHRVDRRLSVTVHAKTTEPGSWAGAEAQDWAQIGAAADEVRIMAYDHAFRESPPGPVAPLPWVEDVLRLAIQQIPTSKIFLGVPTYGYDWPQARPGQDLSWVDVREIADANGVSEQWDEESSSPWFTYADDDGIAHSVWYEDARSLRPKLHLAQRYKVRGVVIWKIGGEDPAVWPVLRNQT